jgi:hypothetical protein
MNQTWVQYMYIWKRHNKITSNKNVLKIEKMFICGLYKNEVDLAHRLEYADPGSTVYLFVHCSIHGK